MALAGQIAIVTGASRGIGRGIALQLGAAGATVYITGRKPLQSDSSRDQSLPGLEKTARGNVVRLEVSERGGKGIAAYVDHSNMNEVKEFFERIERDENGRLDILNIFEAEGKPFYECPPEMWDEVNNVGLR
uniref:SDR family NAD(P)-dependent oxidoreductase n=1 Tax=Angiostrongylus cantonensis TaxID=6313 RepID=A0A0K0DMN4_ANGCA